MSNSIIFGVVAKNKGSKSPMATAGIVCGIIALVLWFVCTFIIGSFQDCVHLGTLTK